MRVHAESFKHWRGWTVSVIVGVQVRQPFLQAVSSFLWLRLFALLPADGDGNVTLPEFLVRCCLGLASVRVGPAVRGSPALSR